MNKKFYKSPVLALLLTCTLTAGNLTFPVLAEDTYPEESRSEENISENKSPPETDTVLFTEPFSPVSTSLILNEAVTLEYSTEEQMKQDLFAKIIQALNTSESEPIAYTIDDFSFDFVREAGEQNITVTYLGNDTYTSCTARTVITITESSEQAPNTASDSSPEHDTGNEPEKAPAEHDTGNEPEKAPAEHVTGDEPEKAPAEHVTGDEPEKGTATVIINSQSITYGETFGPVFSSVPADAKVFGIISGVDRHGNTYLSIDASDITLNDMTGTTLPNGGEQSLQDYILQQAGNELTLRDLSSILDSISQLPGGNGGDIISGIRQAIDTIGQIDERFLDTPVAIGGLPAEPGVYTAVGVTVNPKYNTAIGMGTLTITSQVSNVALAFNQEFDNPANLLPYEQMYNFQFGGHLTEGDPQAAEKMCTLYTGTSFDGEFHTETTPILKPGIYTETIYLSDENYFAVPISRIYTIQRQPVEIRFDNSFVTARYDGTPHGLTAGVYVGNDRIAEAVVSYICFRNGEPVSLDTEQPIETGVYLATAFYLGDAIHQPAFNIEGSLIILGADAVISIYPVQPITLNKETPLPYVKNINTSAADTGDSTAAAGNTAALILSGFTITAVLFRRYRFRNKP